MDIRAASATLTFELEPTTHPAHTMLPMVPRRGILGRGPRMAWSPSSARSVGSVPRLQAQVADIRKDAERGEGVISPLLNNMSGREAALMVRPVAAAIQQNGDEFWRQVPLWENVSAGEFLSYRWSVSLACRRPATALN